GPGPGGLHSDCRPARRGGKQAGQSVPPARSAGRGRRSERAHASEDPRRSAAESALHGGGRRQRTGGRKPEHPPAGRWRPGRDRCRGFPAPARRRVAVTALGKLSPDPPLKGGGKCDLLYSRVPREAVPNSHLQAGAEEVKGTKIASGLSFFCWKEADPRHLGNFGSTIRSAPAKSALSTIATNS